MQTGVVELRNYLLHPGRRDELIELFEREFVEPQEAEGMQLLGLFQDAERPERFVWFRAFPGMDARKRALAAFYEGPIWRKHRDAANATMIDSDDVRLLRPSAESPMLEAERISVRGPILCAIAPERQNPDAAHIERDGGTILGIFVTETAENTYPRLPVREGDRVSVVVTSGLDRDDLRKHVPNAEVIDLVPTARSRVQLSFAGRSGDFAFLTGMRSVTHRRLRERLRGCGEWDTTSGTYRGYSLAGGAVSVDEMDVPSPGVRGCSIRHLDIAARRWSIYWTTSASGKLFAPVHGGFSGDRGEFYGTDSENGVPVLARYIWSGCSTSRPRWEQAFSTDGGDTWETNWTMDFA